MLKAFHLDAASELSSEEQIVHQLGIFQEMGLLESSEQLPTVQELADHLGISTTEVESALLRWQREGLIDFLSPTLTQAKASGYSREQVQEVIDFMWNDL